MPFALDYLALIFLASLGVVQLAALNNGLKGLYFVGIPVLNLTIALALLVGAFLWFFLSEPRNLPDTGGGLDGNRQAILSVIGSVSAVIFTLAVTSLRAAMSRQEKVSYMPGLEALKRSSYVSAVQGTFCRLWAR